MCSVPRGSGQMGCVECGVYSFECRVGIVALSVEVGVWSVSLSVECGVYP